MYRIESDEPSSYATAINGEKFERIHSHWEFKIKLEFTRGKMGEPVENFIVYAWSISTINTRTKTANHTERFSSLQEAKLYVNNWETPLPKDRYISIK